MNQKTSSEFIFNMISDFIWRDSHGLLCSPRKLIWDLADRVADIQLGKYTLHVLFYYSGYLQKSNSMAKNMGHTRTNTKDNAKNPSVISALGFNRLEALFCKAGSH